MRRWASASDRPTKLGTTTTFGLVTAGIGVGATAAGAGVGVAGTCVGKGVHVGTGEAVGVAGPGVGVGIGADWDGSAPPMNQSVMVGRPGAGCRPVWASTVA